MADGIHFYAGPETSDLIANACKGLAFEGLEAGDSVWQVPDSKGKKWVEPDVRHIEKFKLVVGCTAILGMCPKPALVVWGENKVAQASICGKDPNSIDPINSLAAQAFAGKLTAKAYKQACRVLKAEIGAAAAKRGSEIHAILEKYYDGDYDLRNDPYVRISQTHVHAILERLARAGYAFERFGVESSFYHPTGFGGRTDLILYLSHPAIKEEIIYVIDFKTRDFEVSDVKVAEAAQKKGNKGLGKLTPRETEPAQIAANIEGHGGSVAEGTLGANIYLSRTQTLKGFCVEYGQEQLEGGWRLFKALHVVFNELKLKG